jgi:hypothetical protein
MAHRISLVTRDGFSKLILAARCSRTTSLALVVKWEMVGPLGLEPETNRLRLDCSNHRTLRRHLLPRKNPTQCQSEAISYVGAVFTALRVK